MLRQAISAVGTCCGNIYYFHPNITYNIQKKYHHRVIDCYGNDKCQKNIGISLIGSPYCGNITSLRIEEHIIDSRFDTLGNAIASSSYAIEFINNNNKYDNRLKIKHIEPYHLVNNFIMS